MSAELKFRVEALERKLQSLERKLEVLVMIHQLEYETAEEALERIRAGR